MTTKTRFAPSPTGYLHVGGARTALFSWLYTRRHGGQFVLRIEDTDLERSTQASVDAILQGMEWLGLDFDEGPYYQTQRFDRYQAVIDDFLERGLAYRCTCSKERLDALREQQMQNKQKPRYDGKCRPKDQDSKSEILHSADQPHVVRFRTPTEGVIRFHDSIRGEIRFPNNELDDLIIRRSDGSPTYNLSVVVDDSEMHISHVIRGDDHLNNTPRQIHIYNALGATPPTFAHVPMILGDDGARLSKRHGAVSVLQYREEGFLPEALLNYLVRLGWSHGDQELFSISEMQALFDLKDVNKAPSNFNTDKLRWINQHYLKSADLSRLATLIQPHLAKLKIEASDQPRLCKIIDAQRERASTLVELAEGSTFYFIDPNNFDSKPVKKGLKPVAAMILSTVQGKLSTLDVWERSSIREIIESVAKAMDVGFGKIGMPLRAAMTHGAASPDLDLTLELIGKQACLRRIDTALTHIASLPQ